MKRNLILALLCALSLLIGMTQAQAAMRFRHQHAGVAHLGELALVLAQHDVGHVQRAGRHQHDHEAETHRDFVGHHLGRGAQRTQEGVLRVRSPAGDDHAIDFERGDGHQEQQAGVDVGQRDFRAKRDHGPCGKSRHDGHDRTQEEQALVGRRRDDDLLEDQLDRVSDGLQQATWAGAVGARTNLRPGNRLALPQGQISHATEQRQHQRHDLDQRPDHGPGSAQVGGTSVVQGINHLLSPLPFRLFRRGWRRRKHPGWRWPRWQPAHARRWRAGWHPGPQAAPPRRRLGSP